ncbi:hypothetical protein [Mycolicibacterium gilvum]|uniref:Uncharacterized protein n=1 Tax=Mycolicibacterium gilvum TaxID=1804 RepID=A0A378SS36_9MYCO|nr:hypothetical protein [Mycolicibacterium gilvum]MCV7055617.1 hypothetical protein [Mycolicibacterium gilvum]STZ44197.1 Uncharacterised protein [Mycolicibacterium gilvum]
MTVVFFIGFGVIARFIPPPHPGLSAGEIADLYRGHSIRIRGGVQLAMWAGVLCVPWVVAVGLQMKRIEGRFAPLSYVQIGLGVLLPLEFIVPLYFFQAAAYRPGRSDEVIQALNDLGWLPFTGLVYTVVAQAIVVGVAILSDTSATRVFPRWAGYFSIWAGVAMAPASLDVFFTDGPLAWNGAIAWWLLLITFFVWFIGMTVVTLQAISNHEAQFTASNR